MALATTAGVGAFVSVARAASPASPGRTSGLSPDPAASADLGHAPNYLSSLLIPGKPRPPTPISLLRPSSSVHPFISHPCFLSIPSSLYRQLFIPSSVISPSLAPPFVLPHPPRPFTPHPALSHSSVSLGTAESPSSHHPLIPYNLPFSSLDPSLHPFILQPPLQSSSTPPPFVSLSPPALVLPGVLHSPPCPSSLLHR